MRSVEVKIRQNQKTSTKRKDLVCDLRNKKLVKVARLIYSTSKSTLTL